MKIDPNDHMTLAIWAAGCAEHVLPTFERHRPGDSRPRNAIEAAKAWARGELPTSEARNAAFEAHAAARQATDALAVAAARSAGHAAATAHVFTHAPHASAYALKAIHEKTEIDVERARQMTRLPDHLKGIIAS